MTTKSLREFVRCVIREAQLTGADLQKGFYLYNIERGADIHSFWYKSPGRSMGSDGDPGRPEDAAEYIGFKTKDTTPEDAAEDAAPPEEVKPTSTEELPENFRRRRYRNCI